MYNRCSDEDNLIFCTIIPVFSCKRSSGRPCAPSPFIKKCTKKMSFIIEKKINKKKIKKNTCLAAAQGIVACYKKHYKKNKKKGCYIS